MRGVFRAIGDFELAFENEYGISLNEAIVLCILHEATEKVTASFLSKQSGMTASHTSKILRVLEEKKLIERMVGNVDRRLMFFTLTKEGEKRLTQLEQEKLPIPKELAPLFK